MRNPIIHLILVFSFFFGQVSLVSADKLILPNPGALVHLSAHYNPTTLKGLKVHPDNPFRFDFILDQGDETSTEAKSESILAKEDRLKNESTKLIKYFLSSLTIPEGDLWVNLSPYEKDRIVPDSFGQTDMGRDLLAQDYLLKQITASLIYPEDEIGKKFWNKIYKEAQSKFHTTNIPINTFNKVWIVPNKALVYENAKAGTAYVVESSLKVMLEEDYLALDKNAKAGDASFGFAERRSLTTPRAPKDERAAGPATNGSTRHEGASLASQIVREIVIPELTKEINEGKNFAQLRQVYNSLILATWYKKKIKSSILSKVYLDQKKIAGITIDNPQDKKLIYEQYLKAFKKGVYNYIKEEQDPVTQTVTPRKYFSGGVFLGDRAMFTSRALEFIDDETPGVKDILKGARATASLFLAGCQIIPSEKSKSRDEAMVASSEFYFKGLEGLDRDSVRRQIFDGDMDEWLKGHGGRGSKDAMDATIAQMLVDPSFIELIRTKEKSDIPVEIIRYARQHSLNLGTMSLAIFLKALNENLKGIDSRLSKKISNLSLSLASFIQLITAIGMAQSYLDSDEFNRTLANDKLIKLIEFMEKQGEKLNNDKLNAIYAALPTRLSARINKEDIKSLSLSRSVFYQLRSALADNSVQEYLNSEDFRAISPPERLVAILKKMDELHLPVGSDNLWGIYNGLPEQISTRIRKSDIQAVNLTRSAYDQLQSALVDSRVQEFLDGAEFRETPDSERLVSLIEKIRELQIPLNVDNLGQIYSALPQQISKTVAKKDINLVDLPKAVYDQLQNALMDPRVQEYLDSDEFLDMLSADRLAALVEKVSELNIPLETDNLTQIHLALPQQLSPKVKKSDIRKITLSREVYRQLGMALADSRVQEYLEGDIFNALGPSEKLAALVEKILELKFPLDTDNLGYIYSGLPQQLSPKVKKDHLYVVHISRNVYAQLRKALESKDIQDFLDSDEFIVLPSEEKLVSLVEKIESLGLRLDAGNLSHIYSGFPERLSAKTNKGDIQRITLPRIVFDDVRAAIKNPELQAYLDSEEFMKIPTSDRLVTLAKRIEAVSGRPQMGSLYSIYSALPQKLSAKVHKYDIYKVNLSVPVYMQLRAAISDVRMQEYLDSEEFQTIPAEEKLAFVLKKIRELKLPLNTNNLGQIHSGLPQQLSLKTAKKDIEEIGLSFEVYERLIGALSDVRVQSYLDSDEFESQPASDRFVSLVNKMQSFGFVLESSSIKKMYSALPYQLSARISKDDVPSVDLAADVYRELRVALADSRIQEYLESSSFKDIPFNDRLVAILRKMQALNLMLRIDNLTQIHSALPERLSKSITKDAISAIPLNLSSYDRLRSALKDQRVQEYLESDEFNALSPSDKLSALAEKIFSLNLPIGTEKLGNIYTGLPQQLSPRVNKSSFLKTDLPRSAFTQLRTALKHPEVKAYIEGGKFLSLPIGKRIDALLVKIRSLNLRLDTNHRPGIFSSLPSDLKSKFEAPRSSREEIKVIRDGAQLSDSSNKNNRALSPILQDEAMVVPDQFTYDGRLFTKLGEGDQGTVYVDRQKGEAIKIYNKIRIFEPGLLQEIIELVNEIDRDVKVDGFSVVKMKEVVYIPNLKLSGILMEFVEGETLTQNLLKRNSREASMIEGNAYHFLHMIEDEIGPSDTRTKDEGQWDNFIVRKDAMIVNIDPLTVSYVFLERSLIIRKERNAEASPSEAMNATPPTEHTFVVKGSFDDPWILTRDQLQFIGSESFQGGYVYVHPESAELIAYVKSTTVQQRETGAIAKGIRGKVIKFIKQERRSFTQEIGHEFAALYQYLYDSLKKKGLDDLVHWPSEFVWVKIDGERTLAVVSDYVEIQKYNENGSLILFDSNMGRNVEALKQAVKVLTWGLYLEDLGDTVPMDNDVKIKTPDGIGLWKNIDLIKESLFLDNVLVEKGDLKLTTAEPRLTEAWKKVRQEDIKTGGIDLNAVDKSLVTEFEDGEIIFKVDPVLLRRFQNTQGFVPVVVNIQPLKDLPAFLGLN